MVDRFAGRGGWRASALKFGSWACSGRSSRRSSLIDAWSFLVMRFRRCAGAVALAAVRVRQLGSKVEALEFSSNFRRSEQAARAQRRGGRRITMSASVMPLPDEVRAWAASARSWRPSRGLGGSPTSPQRVSAGTGSPERSPPASSAPRNQRAKSTSVDECAIMEAATTTATKWKMRSAPGTPAWRIKRP